jgi:hypothetical protein
MLGTKNFLIGYTYGGDKIAIPVHAIRKIDDCGKKKSKDLYDKKRWAYEVYLMGEEKETIYSEAHGLENFLEASLK